MSNMTINILETNPQIIKLMRDALLIEVNKYFTLTVIQNIINKIKPNIKSIISNAPEAQSLISGDLRGEFGIPNGLEVDFVKSIVLTIANNIQLDFYPIKLTGSSLSGGFTFYVAQEDFADILSLSEATITTDKAQILPWLEWLLLQGNKIIISEHKLKFSPANSRSHSFIMVQDTGSFWSVPPQFAGTIKDNWITRALEDNIKAIQTIVATEMKRVF